MGKSFDVTSVLRTHNEMEAGATGIFWTERIQGEEDGRYHECKVHKPVVND